MLEKGILRNSPDVIEWVRVRNPSPRALLFSPPLIGGNYAQQIRYFRLLLRRGYDLLSFSFSGHGRSSGSFSPEKSREDTLRMLETASAMAVSENLPLFGLAVCYAAIPLLRAAALSGEPFGKIVLINAVLHLNPSSVLKSFLLFYRRVYRGSGIIDGARHYGEFMFPGVVKSRHSFGVLERGRIRIRKSICDFFSADPLENICLPRTPALCLYGLDDRVLQMNGPAFWKGYESDIRRICPHTRFQALKGDHFLSHPPAREKALKAVLDFFQ